MRTAEERAKALLNETYISGAALRAITLALKEQDRITREACAEATMKLARTVSQCPTVDFCRGYNGAIALAHDACLDVKAV